MRRAIETEAVGAAAPATSPELLAVHRLRKAWGARTVLDELELVVDRGTVVGISGANGIGKTTLLRICAGMISADAGVVSLAGLHPRRDRASYQRRVGFLAAGDRGLYARLTPRRHLELWGRVSLLGRDRYAASIERIVAAFALEELGDQRMDRLSMGQRQRVRLAMAFLHEPDLVLLDEPINSLDRRGTDLLLGCVGELTRRGGAVVWCAPTLTDEAPFDVRLHLVGGRLTAAGRS